ncbi:TonB-dependent receptor [Winogradskyella aurantiaca]|uniref:TonB-dependent receptor n=1 Tax=Winogradskyella aurantiaca TaxID=2219558 RepID=UPI000E1E2B09|nr:TonB-dependent receptor [Winogradskyella aurantiaca]
MRIFIMVLAMVTCNLLLSQECKYIFKGTLKDFHDNSVLSSALIYSKSEGKSFVSDENGKFEITGLCEGSLELVISHIACETKSLKFQIKGDRSETIFLEHHIEALNEVVVSGNSIKTESKTLQETSLKEDQLFKYNASSIGDALKEINGVTTINTGNTIAKPMINGLHSNRVLIMTNGVRLQDQEWGIEHAPNVDLTSASQITVIKGAGALAYGGDAIGGVVVVNPKRVIPTDTLFGQTTVGGQSNGWGGFVNSSLNKGFDSGWFINAQGSFRKHGDLRAPDYNLSNTGLEAGGFTINTGLSKFEYGFKVYYSYLRNEIGILRASHTGNVSDLVRAINSDIPLVIEPFTYDINPPKQDVTHQIFKANFYKRLQNFGKLDLNYNYQKNDRLEFDIRRGDRSDIPAVDLELQTHTLNVDVDYDAADAYALKFGILGRYQENFPNPDTGVKRLIPDYNKYDFGAYITSELEYGSGHILEAGLRYDLNHIDALKFYDKSRWVERGYDVDFPQFVVEDRGTQILTNPVFTYNNLSLSLGTRLDLGEYFELLLNFSRAMRAPNPAELFSDGLHHSAARIELGDLRIGQETSNRFASTLFFNKLGFDVQLDLYVNAISDFIYIEPSGQETTNRGPFPVWEYQSNDAVLAGFDFNFSYQFNSSWDFRNQTSYVYGQNTDLMLPLISMPPFQTRNIVGYTKTDWFGFNLQVEHQFVAEQKRFPDNNFEAFIPELGETVLVDISTPPPAFNLFNANVNWNFKVNTTSNLKLAVIVNNIFDTTYRNYLNQLRYFADEMGRNVLVQLQLNY